MTIDELETALIERECSISLHLGADGWTVWLFDPRVPFELAATRAEALENAIVGAFESWDNGSAAVSEQTATDAVDVADAASEGTPPSADHE